MSDDHKDNHGGGGGEGHGDGHAKKGHGGGGHGHGGGSHEEHEGAPEWLISFADNVALLMGFFVILLAMNMSKPTAGGIGGEGKYPSEEPSDRMLDFVIEMRSAFKHPIDINSKDPLEAPLRKRMLERLKQGESTDPGPDGDKRDVQALRPTDYVNIAGYLTFRDNTSDIEDKGFNTVKDVAAKIRGHNFMIEVRGHCSAIEARDDKVKAIKLAYDRALATAQALAAQGVDWELMRVVACADNERATPRAGSIEEHHNNQRAEIVITQEQRPASPYAQPALTH